MQFNFNCEESLDCDEKGFAILEGSYKNRILPGFTLYVNEILDKMGEASSQAQNLPTIITTSQKFFTSNHRIVLKAEKDKVLGFIKVGVKKLYLRDRHYNYHEVSPLCVLDFYVHESVQRKGIGKQLFDYMINFEKKNPKEIAYDKPNDKLLNFLQKYFNLANFIQQNNNYVVFDEFFNYIANNLTYDNSTNRAIRAIPNNDNNINISNNNNYQQSNFNLSKSQNFNNPNLVNVGQNLIYNNSFDNKVINKEVYKNPVTGFQQYYLTGGDTVTYDNIYSKRKINLINDYLSSFKKDENQYLKEQLGNQENSIANSNGRLNQIMNKISDISSSNRYNYDQLYNKRNQYATVFDDKKIVEHNYYIQKNNNIDNKDIITQRDYRNSSLNHIINGKKSPQNLQHYSPFSRYGKVYTNVLPTTSSNYGNYYNNQDLNQREQSPNKLYY